MEKKRYEEVAYVLDFLPQGKSRFGREYMAEPTVQMIGEEFFTLLEASVRRGVTVSANERIYIGKERRDKIDHIIGRITYEELTSVAKSDLLIIVEKIVKEHENKYIDFFNTAHSITPRMHTFELLPGIGKKYMRQIVDVREKNPFTSFTDIQQRTGMPDPVKIVAKRIIEELTTEQKYYIFIRQF